MALHASEAAIAMLPGIPTVAEHPRYAWPEVAVGALPRSSARMASRHLVALRAVCATGGVLEVERPGGLVTLSAWLAVGRSRVVLRCLMAERAIDLGARVFEGEPRPGLVTLRAVPSRLVRRLVAGLATGRLHVVTSRADDGDMPGNVVSAPIHHRDG